MAIPLRDDELMTKEIYDGALKWNVEMFEGTMSDDQYLLRKTFELNTILHIAIRTRPYPKYKPDEEDAHGHQQKRDEFLRIAITRFPQLLWEMNLDGNTPLHLAAAGLSSDKEFATQVCERVTDDDLGTLLRMKNKMGNTPLHLALICYNHAVAFVMLSNDPSLATILNNSLEAPLHLIIKYFPTHIFGGYSDTSDPVLQSKCKERKKMEFIGLLRDEDPSWVYPEHEDKKYTATEYSEMVIVMVLLEKASYVVGWKDASGATPLHLAANLDKDFNLVLISYMIHCCPPSMEVCDSSGKTILHLLIHRILYLSEADDSLYIPYLYTLRNHQDYDGNTPMHLALIKNDSIMQQLLYTGDLPEKVNIGVKNKAGQSILMLTEQEECGKFLDGSAKGLMMTEEMCRIAECGNLITLDYLLCKKIGRQYYEAKDCDGKNLVHKAFQIKQQGQVIIPENVGFMDSMIRNFPYMLSDTDKTGDNPLHILAQLHPNDIMIHLAVADGQSDPENPYPGGSKPNDPIFFTSPYNNYTYVWDSLESTTFLEDRIKNCHLWNPHNFNQGCSTQNVKGNTPLHEAIVARNFTVFCELAKLNTIATTLVNNNSETVLHLLATVNSLPASINDDVLRNILNHHLEVDQSLCDKDGLTPLMKAVKVGNIAFAERMCSLCPKIAELKGSNGKTMWHVIAISPLLKIDVPSSPFFTDKVVRNQLKIKDHHESTALHTAIHHRNFAIARLFLTFRKRDGTKKFHEHLLETPNKDGKTPSELIGGLPYLPPDFEDYIWKDSTMIGTRSMWRIPTTRMDNYVNTMGVIAALLATITFTAAFAVPGGLNQENGAPLLISNPAFQVFMISNVVAMCLSMMVLFCLLWIMATGDISKSVVILDFSIMLLLAAFFLTLLTFMTGLYATTHLVKRWLAMLSLVLCSLFLLLMLIYLLGALVIPSRKAIRIYVVRSYKYAEGLCKHNISRIQKRCCPRSDSPGLETHSLTHTI